MWCFFSGTLEILRVPGVVVMNLEEKPPEFQEFEESPAEWPPATSRNSWLLFFITQTEYISIFDNDAI
jgi:hypothetical protein